MFSKRNREFYSLSLFCLFGFTVELKEGKNILKITYCPGIEKSVHFRDIYFAEHVPFNTEDVDYTLLG